MKYIDLELPSAAENLACDEALLELCEAGDWGEVLRFWEPQEPFVVLGYGNHAATEADLEACRGLNIGIFRRCTGGGAVLQGPGCLNYSLILQIAGFDPLRTITGANRFVMERHRAALQALVEGCIEIQGHTDLAIGGLKFSGNSQRRKREFLIFHGSLLLNLDLSLVERALRMPSRQPDYRRGRSHKDFLVNLGKSPEDIKQALRETWQAWDAPREAPLAEIQALARNKYSREEWNLRI
jgi:lipoate-protein ligase A